MSDDDDVVEPDPAAIEAQRELIARRDALLAARERLNDPWADHSDRSAAPAQPLDSDKVMTGLADLGHQLGDSLQHAGQELGGVPIVGAPLAAGATAAGAVAHGAANLRDRDHDGLTDGQERVRRTNPNNPDTDSDGLPDGAEVNVYHSNPNRQDTDRDGVSDFDEASRAGITYDRDGTAHYTPTSALKTPAKPAAPKPHDGPITSPSQVPDAGPVNQPPGFSPYLGLESDAGGAAGSAAGSGETIGYLVDPANPWTPGDPTDMPDPTDLTDPAFAPSDLMPDPGGSGDPGFVPGSTLDPGGLLDPGFTPGLDPTPDPGGWGDPGFTPDPGLTPDPGGSGDPGFNPDPITPDIQPTLGDSAADASQTGFFGDSTDEM